MKSKQEMKQERYAKPGSNSGYGLANKKHLKQVQTGFWCEPGSRLVKQFGCDFCSWRSSQLCPHGLSGDERHCNRICSERIKYIQSLYALTGNKPRTIQVDQAIKSQLLTDKMLSEYGNGDELNKNYHQIQRNLINLLDKMRRQDEGIKFQGEMHHTIDEFRKIVDAQAKIVKDKDIIKEAEIIDKQDNSRNREENRFEVQGV